MRSVYRGSKINHPDGHPAAIFGKQIFGVLRGRWVGGALEAASIRGFDELARKPPPFLLPLFIEPLVEMNVGSARAGQRAFSTTRGGQLHMYWRAKGARYLQKHLPFRPIHSRLAHFLTHGLVMRPSEG